MAFLLIVKTVPPFRFRGVLQPFPALIPSFDGELAVSGSSCRSCCCICAAWRRAYDGARWPSYARALVAMLCSSSVLTVYRMLLFTLRLGGSRSRS